MAELWEEVAGSVHRRLLSIGSHESENLDQNLASECRIQLERIRAMLKSSREAERIIGYVDSLSIAQRALLVGRVTLRLLRKITGFMEDMDGGGLFNSSSSDSDKEPICSRLLHFTGNASENIPRSSNLKRYDNKETVSELGYGVWGDTDSALILLILYEAQDQECLEAAKKYGVDPLLYKNFIVGKIPANHDLQLKSRCHSQSIREYLCENILKLGFCVPGLMVGFNTQTAVLVSYVDIINRYQRLHSVLTNLEGNNNNNNDYFKGNPCPASVASVLCLPLVINDIGSKDEETQKVCSICGDDFEAGTYLPCSHVFHWNCIHPWLKARNTCPVCRYELPTDDVCYELRRHMRILMQRTLC